MKELWHSLFYQPLYNALIAIIAFVPGHSVGVGIIVLTLMVKGALLPLTAKSSRAQRAMKVLDPAMKAIKERHKDNKEAQAKAMMELYKEHKVTPFSGCLPILLQLPFIIGLYFVFWKGLSIDPAIIYSFVPHPESLNTHFLGLDLAGRSILLAVLAGATQFGQAWLVSGKTTNEPKEEKKEKGESSFQDDFQKSMQIQMLYILPIMIGVFAYSISAAVALYWTVSNIVSIAQELYIKRKVKPDAIG
jgi:YidC/Oxa1 family membrane protein insertase